MEKFHIRRDAFFPLLQGGGGIAVRFGLQRSVRLNAVSLRETESRTESLGL